MWIDDQPVSPALGRTVATTSPPAPGSPVTDHSDPPVPWLLVAGLAVVVLVLAGLAARYLLLTRRPRRAAAPVPSTEEVEPSVLTEPPVPTVPPVPTEPPVPAPPAPPDPSALLASVVAVGAAAPGGALAAKVDRVVSGAYSTDDLVKLAIDLRDQLDDATAADLRAGLRGGLATVGITEVVVAAVPVDTTTQAVFSTVPTTDPALDLVVARTVRVGYRAGTRLVRPPEVEVHRYQPPP
jgi:hypothetical protein